MHELDALEEKVEFELGERLLALLAASLLFRKLKLTHHPWISEKEIEIGYI